MIPEEFAQRLTETEARSKSNTHRIDKMEERQTNLDKLVTSVEVLATKQENIESDVQEIKSDVKSLMAAPGKRWEAIIEKTILVVVGAVITYLLARAGIVP